MKKFLWTLVAVISLSGLVYIGVEYGGIDNETKKYVEETIERYSENFDVYEEYYDSIETKHLKEEDARYNKDAKFIEVIFTATDKFSDESAKTQHKIMNDLYHMLDYPDNKDWYFDVITFVDGDDIYERATGGLGYKKSKLELNGEEIYRPEEVANKTETSSDDSDTTLDGKVGSDWNELTENQKFHAVSNALYSLDMNGYTILESEQYYINALDKYFKDEENYKKPVDRALANIGIEGGSIQ